MWRTALAVRGRWWRRLGTERTNWRTGTWGKTWSTRWAAVSAMRLALQEGQAPRPCRRTPPESRSRSLGTGPERSRGPRCRTSGSCGTRSPRGWAHRRPWDRIPKPGPGSSPGALGRCGTGWWSRAGGVGRVGHGGCATASAGARTSGTFSRWVGCGWPPVAQDVERNGALGLDGKEIGGAGQENGETGRKEGKASASPLMGIV